MRPPLVTEASVHAAIDALLVAGKGITCLAVREQLGGGSLRDISTHVRSWRQKNFERVISAPDSEQPSDDLAKCLRDLAGKIDLIASRRTASEVHRIRLELDARNQEVLQQLENAEREVAGLLEAVDQQADTCALLQERLDQQLQSAQELSRQLAEERTQHAVAVASAKEAQARVADMKDAQTDLLRQLAAERDLTGRLRQRERDLENELKDARASRAGREVEVARVLGQAEATNQQLSQQVERLESQLLVASQALTDSQLALLERTEEAAKASGEARASTQLWEGLQRVLDRRQPPTKAKAVVTGINTKVTP